MKIYEEELTPEQLEEIKTLIGRPDVYDEDNPPLTKEQLSKFYRVRDKNKANRRKQTVTLRISQQALDKARMLGKGYTSVLGRILEDALNDNDTIEKYL